MISAIEKPNPFEAGQKVLAAMFNHWKISEIMTYGSGRPAKARASGDPNQDGNTSNDRLSKYRRNALLGPDYATMDLTVARKMNLGGRYRLELTGESLHLFNRDNQRDGVTDNGYYNSAGTLVKYSQSAGGAFYPAYYQQPTSFLRPTSSFAPRRMQLSMRLDSWGKMKILS
jgi:hypothetical protein